MSRELPFTLILSSLPRRKAILVALVGVIGFVAPMTFGLVLGIPEPRVHDEFSYLLGAETFASGRVTNPPHSLRRHFETIHVLQEPTYMTKYPPAQSLVLALGILLGHPIIGVWLSVAAMAAATCWMLLAWTTPRWAAIGGLISVILFGTTNDWAQSYWGGCVAATGGALLFGAVARVRRRVKFSDAFILGFSLLVLGNSRPFEGMVLAVGAAIIWFPYVLCKREWRPRALRTVLPVVLVLVAGGSLMVSYNKAVTGDSLTLPYKAYQSRYDPNPIFAFLPLGEVPQDLSPRMRRFNEEYSIPRFEAAQGWSNHLGDGWRMLEDIKEFYFSGVTILAVLLTLPWLIASRKTLSVILLLTLLFLAENLSVWWLPHYSAIATSLIVLLSVEALRRLSLLGGRSSRFRLRPTWILLILVLEWGITEIPLGAVTQSDVGSLVLDGDGRATTTELFPTSRTSLSRYLLDEGGYHLAIVSYADGYPVHEEWVYNNADIDDSRVVWAHDLGQNDELLSYFLERKIWNVEVAVGKVTASEYLVDR